MLSREQELDLSGIAYHWRDAYSIAMSDCTWTARPHDEPEAVLTANSSDGLRELIRADYFKRTGSKRLGNRTAPVLGERTST